MSDPRIAGSGTRIEIVDSFSVDGSVSIDFAGSADAGAVMEIDAGHLRPDVDGRPRSGSDASSRSETRPRAGSRGSRGSRSSKSPRGSRRGSDTPQPREAGQPAGAATAEPQDAGSSPDIHAGAAAAARPASAPSATAQKKSPSKSPSRPTPEKNESPFVRRNANGSPSRLRPTSSSLAAAARRSLPKERPVWGVRSIESPANVTVTRIGAPAAAAPRSPPSQRTGQPPFPASAGAAPSVSSMRNSAPTTPTMARQPSLRSLQPVAPFVSSRAGFENAWCRSCGAKQDLSALQITVQTEMKAAEALLVTRNEEARAQYEAQVDVARRDFETQVENAKFKFEEQLRARVGEHERELNAVRNHLESQLATKQNDHVYEVQRLLADHHATEERYKQQLMAQAQEHEYIMQTFRRDREFELHQLESAHAAELERLNKRVEQLTYVVSQVGKLQLQGYAQLSTALDGETTILPGTMFAPATFSPAQARHAALNGSAVLPPRMPRVDSFVNSPSRPGLVNSFGSAPVSRVNNNASPAPSSKDAGGGYNVREGAPSIDPSPASSKASGSPRDPAAAKPAASPRGGTPSRDTPTKETAARETHARETPTKEVATAAKGASPSPRDAHHPRHAAGGARASPTSAKADTAAAAAPAATPAKSPARNGHAKPSPKLQKRTDMPTDEELAGMTPSEQLELLFAIRDATTDPNVRKIIQPRIGRIIASMPDDAVIDQLRISTR